MSKRRAPRQGHSWEVEAGYADAWCDATNHHVTGWLDLTSVVFPGRSRQTLSL